ncbi:MAG: cupin domain-containing protein [Burkholderiales bacterium]
MAVTFNETSAAPEVLTPGVAQQRLLHAGRVAHTKVVLDRITVAKGASLEMRVGAADLAWFQILEGEACFAHASGIAELGATHIVFMPPGFAGTLTTASGALLLHAQVPNAIRFDPALASEPPQFRVVDWAREPVLDSEHDARKRIYVATPKLFGTTAIKGEMIIYPPGTEAANHHHEGAEHFMYVIKGRGTAYANEQPIPVRKGDLIYYDEHERHYLRSEGAEEMVFVEFFVPGRYKTVWAPGAAICTWNPTGRTIRGEIPAREIKGHSSALPTPQDV